jgi:hypothetical protein
MRTHLLGEAPMEADSRARMPGLFDYQNCATSSAVEEAFDIDVRRWRRGELLIPGTTFLCHWLTDNEGTAMLKVRVESEEQVRLIYRVRVPGKRWQKLERAVTIVWDSCRYGGRRPWFICPNCGDSLAVLYLGGASPFSFSCRRCAGLKYLSQCSGPRLSLMRKAQKIRRQLGGSGSLDERFPDKPRTMRWKRYLRTREMGVQTEEEWLRRSAYLFRWLEREAAR